MDYNDKATIKASKYIPHGGYKQFLKVNGLKGKRLGIVRKPFYNFGNETFLKKIFAQHLDTLNSVLTSTEIFHFSCETEGL